MTGSSYDVVVIGSGINGLVAAAELAGAGRRVAVVEERDRLGGFIASDELTVPGFVHDTFSSWHPLFQAGPGYAALADDLHRHGLVYCNVDAGSVTASVSDRGVVIADRDPEITAAGFEHAADARAYAELLEGFGRVAPQVFGALGSELAGRDLLRLGGGAVRGLGAGGSRELVRVAAQNARALLRERFVGWEVDQLWAPWLLHAGLGPDHATGGLFLPVMAGTMHQAGLPVVRGGAGEFVAAFSALLAERGVEVQLGTSATGIEVRDGAVTGVRTTAGVLAAPVVLASTSTTRLYDELVPAAAVSEAGRTAARRHRPGRAAMQVHVALDRPLAWTDGRLDRVPLVHVSDGVGSTGIACAQAEAGLLPGAPTVVVGQQCVLDPSRAPTGKATLWLQLQELPWAPVGDAAGELDTTRGWTEDLTTAYVERVLTRVERYAPGLRDSVLGVHALSPVRLAAENANAVHGDPYGGAAELDQSLVWRPGTGTGHRTGVAGLFHIGATTHPGPGLGGGSGHLVAQHLLTPPLSRRLADRLRRPLEGVRP